ncbi:MAG: hypothetical protein R3286_08840 [Gammaproteobacteria bacterium]|nr:hypothetical protein [Gammaproteobacteria bacterium]
MKQRDGREPDKPGKPGRLSAALGKFQCALGVHDTRVLEVRFGVGKGNSIERSECRRCGLITQRRR